MNIAESGTGVTEFEITICDLKLRKAFKLLLSIDAPSNLWNGVGSIYEPLLPSYEFSNHELASIAAYLGRLQSIKPDEVKTPLENGFTSAFSLKEIIDLIFGRMSSFQGDVVAGLDPRIIAFTRETQVLSRVERAMEVCKETFSVRLNHQLPVEDRRLSSVDCGPHNMLWRADGSLVVLDFEYGGWDHPLRVIGDMLAGDKMRGLTEAQKAYFIERYLAGSSLSQAVLVDLGAFLAFSDIEWIMIYMTSLLPAKLARLQHAKGPSYDMDAYLSQQMEKIREKLDRLGPA